MSLGNMREHGVRSVLALCREASCDHSSSINVDSLPDDFPVPDVSLRLRCSACGSRNVKTQHCAIIELIAADKPDAFLDDTPTAALIRQVLGAVSQFEKAMVVSKLKAARNRKRREPGRKVEGRKGYAEMSPDLVRLAKRLHRYPINGRRRSLREVAKSLAAHRRSLANHHRDPRLGSHVARQDREGTERACHPHAARVRMAAGSGQAGARADRSMRSRLLRGWCETPRAPPFQFHPL
jgi:hypothetical protein